MLFADSMIFMESPCDSAVSLICRFYKWIASASPRKDGKEGDCFTFFECPQRQYRKVVIARSWHDFVAIHNNRIA